MTRKCTQGPVSALIVAAVMCAASTSAQAQKQFLWKFADGDSYRVEVVQDLTQTVAITDQTIEIPAKIGINLMWEIESVDEDGVAEIVQTVEQVTMKMTLPGVAKDVEYDSSSLDEPLAVVAPIADVIQPMIGVEFRQRMEPSGRVFDVRVPKDAFQGLESNQMLQQFFSGEAFKQMISKASPVFPDTIATGGTWQNEATQTTPVGTVTLTSKYTYDGQQQKDDKTLDKFSVALTMAVEAVGRNRKTKVEITKQDNKGTMWFDASEGYLAESTLQQSISMKVTSGDTIVDQTVKNTMKMTVEKE